MGEMFSILKSTGRTERLGLLGETVGVGLFVTLLYKYGDVLIDACVRAVR